MNSLTCASIGNILKIYMMMMMYHYLSQLQVAEDLEMAKLKETEDKISEVGNSFEFSNM